MQTVPLWINGKSVQSQSGRFGDVFDPALGESTKRVGFANGAEITATSLLPRRHSQLGVISHWLDASRSCSASVSC
jgi:hypothetical protein